jgi:hypothetical protein
MSDLDTSEVVNEEEVVDLGIKRKNDVDIDVDPDAILDPEEILDTPLEDEEKDVDDETVLGVDKDIVDYMFSQSDHE